MKNYINIAFLLFSLTFVGCSSEKEIENYYNASNFTKEIDLNYDQDRDSDTNITDNYRYQLPVIFHIFYFKDLDDRDLNKIKNTYDISRIAYILKNVNDLWKGLYDSESKGRDMGVDFVLATHNEKGEKLKYPGIEYVEWTGDSINPQDFMKWNKKGRSPYTSYIWEPNDYINIMLYPFKSNNNDKAITLGISHLPYNASGHELEGLKATDKTFITKSNLAFPYCVSINECYASAKYDSKRYIAFLGRDRYNSSMVDVSSTLAHELGHYLGLLHVFTEKDNGEYADDCKDTDYCEDTPTYNKLEYDKWLTEYLKMPEISFTKAIKRTNCEGEDFDSHNIMDYSVTCADRITEDQHKRIRNVLYYSPLIPGPKKNKISSAKTRASYSDEIINLPIMIRK